MLLMKIFAVNLLFHASSLPYSAAVTPRPYGILTTRMQKHVISAVNVWVVE
jgi:hypothetical protein